MQNVTYFQVPKSILRGYKYPLDIIVFHGHYADFVICDCSTNEPKYCLSVVHVYVFC